MFITQLSTPFGFLIKNVQSIETRLVKEDAEEEFDETKGDHRYFSKEKALEKTFDDFVGKLA